MATFMSFAVLLLSALGASALSIADIGLMVLPDQGNPNNTDTCTFQDFNTLAVDLDTKVGIAEDNYMYTTTTMTTTTNNGVRRELQDNQGDITDLDNTNAVERHRKLVNCAVVCQGFTYGHCKLVYPSCAPRRELEEAESLEATLTTATTQNLRGGERQLQTPAPTVLANGFMSGYSVDHPNAGQLCADLKASMNADILGTPNRLSMSASCKALWRKSFKIGCIYTPALP